MRIRPFLFFFVASSLGALLPVSGAPTAVREQVESLLALTKTNPVPGQSDSTAAAAEIAVAAKQARSALERAVQARTAAGPEDGDIATALDETALEWASLAKDLGELTSLQTSAEKAEATEAELDAKLKREKAHLEETEARRGRALAALNKLGEASNAPPASGASGAPATGAAP